MIKELLIVGGLGLVVIGGVLSSCSKTGGGTRSPRISGDFNVIGASIRMYEVNNGRPPSTEQGLMALVSEPQSGPKPIRWVKLADEVPRDPWQNPYEYKCVEADGGGWTVSLICVGPDGLLGSEDDLVREIGTFGSDGRSR